MGQSFFEQTGTHYRLMAYPQAPLEARLQDLVREAGLVFPAEGLGISLAVFVMSEAEEEKLQRWLQRLCQQQPALLLELNNFGAILPDRIGARIQNTQPVLELQLQLKKLLAETGAASLQFPLARISMSVGLKATEFEKEIQRWGGMELHENLQVQSIQLLKKTGEFAAYRPCGVFGLRPIDEHLNLAI